MATTHAFVHDLADRLAGRAQITSAGLHIYRSAVEAAFGWWGTDFGQLVKVYAADWEAAKGRYSPAECIGAGKSVVMGNPHLDMISTSHVERMNLTTRMQVRRFTRLTNAYSKKLANHLYAVALHVTWVNHCRPSQALSKGKNKAMTRTYTDARGRARARSGSGRSTRRAVQQPDRPGGGSRRLGVGMSGWVS